MKPQPQPSSLGLEGELQEELEELQKIPRNLEDEGLRVDARYCAIRPYSRAAGNAAEWKIAKKRVGTSAKEHLTWLLNIPPWTSISDRNEELMREVAIFLGDRDILLPSLKWLLRHVTDLRTRLLRNKLWKGFIKQDYLIELNDKGRLQIQKVPTIGAYPCLVSRIMWTLIQGHDLLCTCRRRECGKLFIRNKRQRYCSARCGARVRLRKHRKSKKIEAAMAQYRNTK